MDGKALAEYLDQTRWLLNNGLINDGVKNQLMFYGSIVHKDIQAVELSIDVAAKVIEYKLFVNDNLQKNIDLYNKLYKSNSIYGMWKFKRLLKKEGNLNFNHIISTFVKDYCGPKWLAKVNVLNISEYVEGYEKDGDVSDTASDKRSNE